MKEYIKEYIYHKQNESMINKAHFREAAPAGWGTNNESVFLLLDPSRLQHTATNNESIRNRSRVRNQWWIHKKQNRRIVARADFWEAVSAGQGAPAPVAARPVAASAAAPAATLAATPAAPMATAAVAARPQQVATHCITLQRIATHCKTLLEGGSCCCCSTPAGCNILQHAATRATHSNTL